MTRDDSSNMQAAAALARHSAIDYGDDRPTRAEAVREAIELGDITEAQAHANGWL